MIRGLSARYSESPLAQTKAPRIESSRETGTTEEPGSQIKHVSVGLFPYRPGQTIWLVPHGDSAYDFQGFQIHDRDIAIRADSDIGTPAIGRDQDARRAASQAEQLDLFASCRVEMGTV